MKSIVLAESPCLFSFLKTLYALCQSADTSLVDVTPFSLNCHFFVAMRDIGNLKLNWIPQFKTG
jgi:hypothetical protein